MIHYAYKTKTTSCGLPVLGLQADEDVGRAGEITCSACRQAIGLEPLRHRADEELEPSASWEQWDETGHARPETRTPIRVEREVASAPCDA